MKHWINKNYKTLIIAAFLIPIITVAVVSISHVTKWYGISNPVSWAIYLSIGIEIAALSALAAISADMGKKVYFPFIIVTLIQFIGNIYFAYSYIDIASTAFKDWVDLVSPLVSFMGVEANDMVGHKRFLALFAGGMLPIISLSFLHMLVKFTEEDRKKEVDDENKAQLEAKDLMAEVSRIRLTEADLKKLEETLLNPPPPNDNLKKAAEDYKNLFVDEDENNLINEPTLEEENENFFTINQNNENVLQEAPKLTETPTPTPTINPTETPTPTPTEIGTPTPTPTPTETGTPTPTPTYLDKINVIARDNNFFNIPAEGNTDEPKVSDDFTIGPNGAFEMTDDIIETLDRMSEDELSQYWADQEQQYKIAEEEIFSNTQINLEESADEDELKKKSLENPQEDLVTIILETPTLESQDFKENLYWETSDEINPNQIIYDLENNRVIIPTSEEEIIAPTPIPAPQKIISRNVNPRRRNFR